MPLGEVFPVTVIDRLWSAGEAVEVLAVAVVVVDNSVVGAVTVRFVGATVTPLL